MMQFHINRDKITAPNGATNAAWCLTNDPEIEDQMAKKILSPEARERKKVADAAYYKANKEKIAAKIAAYREANPDKAKEQNKKAVKKYVEAHPERRAAASKAWRESHLDAACFSRRDSS